MSPIEILLVLMFLCWGMAIYSTSLERRPARSVKELALKGV